MKIYSDLQKTFNQIDKALKKYHPEFFEYATITPVKLDELNENVKNYISSPHTNHFIKIDYIFEDDKNERYNEYLDKMIKNNLLVENLRGPENYDKKNLFQNLLKTIYYSRNTSRSFPLTNHYLILDYSRYNTKYIVNFNDSDSYSTLKKLVHDFNIVVKFLHNYISNLNLDFLNREADRIYNLIKNGIEDFDSIVGKNFSTQFSLVRSYGRSAGFYEEIYINDTHVKEFIIKKIKDSYFAKIKKDFKTIKINNQVEVVSTERSNQIYFLDIGDKKFKNELRKKFGINYSIGSYSENFSKINYLLFIRNYGNYKKQIHKII